MFTVTSLEPAPHLPGLPLGAADGSAPTLHRVWTLLAVCLEQMREGHHVCTEDVASLARHPGELL